MSEFSQEKLKDAFDYVRKIFFPQWRRGVEWTVKVDANLAYYGRCDDGSKTILVQAVPENDDKLHLILIHEICHAITGEPHTKKWRNRLRQAGDTAKEIGRQQLANMIYREVERSSQNEKPPRLNERLIYSTIEDVILVDSDLSFEATIETVAQLWGIAPEDVTQFKDCKRVYEETIKMMRQFESQMRLEAGQS